MMSSSALLSPLSTPVARAATRAVLFALCAAGDLFVLRPAWTGLRIADGQFRRGYFERFADGIGLAVDDAIRPVFPSCVLMNDGALAVPPGMVAVAPLPPREEYALTADSGLAPYVVFGRAAPLAEHALGLPGEARLISAQTLALRGTALAVEPWDAGRPWGADSAQLAALGDACVAGEDPATLTVGVDGAHLRLRLGKCSLSQPFPPGDGAPLVAAVAGPEWVRIARRSGWRGKRWFVWQVGAFVVAKVAALWWGLGLPAAVVASAVLAGAALFAPVAATLTWPLMLLAGAAASILRAGWLVLRRLPARWRPPAALAAVSLLGGAYVLRPREPPSFTPIMRTHHDLARPDTCAVVGYSAAGGASLRGADQQLGPVGLRWYLDRECGPCREQTASLTAGGELLEWARDAYCASPDSFAAGGEVFFLGGANDDFLSGMLPLARLFIVSEQGPEPWRRSQAPAAAASMATIDAQSAAIGGLIECVRSRRARFFFLHDFLVTDLVAGREPERSAMLARRRAAVEASGGRFVDLLDTFAAEAGVAWFNDYVHPSLVAHQRFAALACDLARSDAGGRRRSRLASPTVSGEAIE